MRSSFQEAAGKRLTLSFTCSPFPSLTSAQIHSLSSHRPNPFCLMKRLQRPTGGSSKWGFDRRESAVNVASRGMASMAETRHIRHIRASADITESCVCGDEDSQLVSHKHLSAAGRTQEPDTHFHSSSLVHDVRPSRCHSS